jgi:ABC-type multidrug transport system fused ATPase/permease subunit
MHQRGAEVDDWSWRRTRRRLGMLVRFTRPYRTRTLFSIGSLLLATAFALAPPLLSKYAVDDGIRQHDLGKLWWIVGAFLVFGLLSWGMSYVQTYLTGWVGERILADLRNSLFDHLQDLSLGFYERNRAA